MPSQTSTTSLKKFIPRISIGELYSLVKHGILIGAVIAPILFFLASHGVFDTFWDKMGLVSKSTFNKSVGYNAVVLCVTSGLFEEREKNDMLLGFVNGTLNSDSLLYMLIRKSNEKKN